MDDAIADIAVVFHWSASDCDEYDLHELMQWRERARARWETSEK